jgi:hypothetical protein
MGTPQTRSSARDEMTNITSSPDKKKKFWDTFLRAVETEPAQIRSLKGSSGLSHPFVAAGADRVRKRLVVISGEPDGRSAALAQADVQTQFRDYRVVFARPIAVNLAKAAEGLAVFFRKVEITQRDVDKLVRMADRGRPITERRVKRVVQTGFVPALRALGYATLNGPAAWQDFFLNEQAGAHTGDVVEAAYRCEQRLAALRFIAAIVFTFSLNTPWSLILPAPISKLAV